MTLFEQAPEPEPVGAGILLQPTEMEVLERLGVTVPGAEVHRLRCTNAPGRTLLDLRYDVIGAHGLGVHRGALFDPLEAAGVELRLGVRVTEPPRDALMGPAARIPWVGRQMAGLMLRRPPGT